jgi:hypothetical protein
MQFSKARVLSSGVYISSALAPPLPEQDIIPRFRWEDIGTYRDECYLSSLKCYHPETLRKTSLEAYNNPDFGLSDIKHWETGSFLKVKPLVIAVGDRGI